LWFATLQGSSRPAARPPLRAPPPPPLRSAPPRTAMASLAAGLFAVALWAPVWAAPAALRGLAAQAAPGTNASSAAKNLTSAADVEVEAQAARDCCAVCDGGPGAAFCSPMTFRCYGRRWLPYYKPCGALAPAPPAPAPAPPQDCCDVCDGGPGAEYCDPVSVGPCYGSPWAPSYKHCAPAPPQDCCDVCDGGPGAEYCDPVSVGPCYGSPWAPSYKHCAPAR